MTTDHRIFRPTRRARDQIRAEGAVFEAELRSKLDELAIQMMALEQPCEAFDRRVLSVDSTSPDTLVFCYWSDVFEGLTSSECLFVEVFFLAPVEPQQAVVALIGVRSIYRERRGRDE